MILNVSMILTDCLSHSCFISYIFVCAPRTRFAIKFMLTYIILHLLVTLFSVLIFILCLFATLSKRCLLPYIFGMHHRTQIFPLLLQLQVYFYIPAFLLPDSICWADLTNTLRRCTLITPSQKTFSLSDLFMINRLLIILSYLFADLVRFFDVDHDDSFSRAIVPAI